MYMPSCGLNGGKYLGRLEDFAWGRLGQNLEVEGKKVDGDLVEPGMELKGAREKALREDKRGEPEAGRQTASEPKLHEGHAGRQVGVPACKTFEGIVESPLGRDFVHQEVGVHVVQLLRHHHLARHRLLQTL